MRRLIREAPVALLLALAACAPQQGEDRRLVVTDSSITFNSEQGSKSVKIADLERIAMRTNDRGPLEDDVFWVFSTPQATLEVPSGTSGEEDLWPLFESLPGFDHGKIIEASTSSTNAKFVCWTKTK